MNSINQNFGKCSLFLLLTSCAYLKKPVKLIEGADKIKTVRQVPKGCQSLKALDFRTSSTDAFEDAINKAKNQAVMIKGNILEISSLTSRGDGHWVRFIGEVYSCPESSH